MKVYEKKEIPARVAEQYLHTVCDVCGAVLPHNWLWEGGITMKRVKEGMYHREVTSCGIDFCDECWGALLLALQNMGYKGEPETNYYDTYDRA